MSRYPRVSQDDEIQELMIRWKKEYFRLVLKRGKERMNKKYIDSLSEKGAKDLLKKLIKKLDELDLDDTFGSR